MKFGFYTLGCKVNQYETQAMEQLLKEQGHQVAPFEDICDGYIINTCSVTAVADKKNRAVIRRCRKQNPNAVIGVCGCYPQHAQEQVKRWVQRWSAALPAEKPFCKPCWKPSKAKNRR